MIRINKRGLVHHWADLVFTVFFGLLLFFFLNGVLQGSVKAQEKTSLEMLNQAQAQELLLTYLRTPVEEGTISDLIVRAEQQPEHQAKLQQRTKKFVQNAGNRLFQGIVINYPQDEIPLLFPEYLQKLSAYATISLYNSQNQEIKVTLYGELKASEYSSRFPSGGGV